MLHYTANSKVFIALNIITELKVKINFDRHTVYTCKYFSWIFENRLTVKSRQALSIDFLTRLFYGPEYKECKATKCSFLASVLKKNLSKILRTYCSWQCWTDKKNINKHFLLLWGKTVRRNTVDVCEIYEDTQFTCVYTRNFGQIILKLLICLYTCFPAFVITHIYYKLFFKKNVLNIRCLSTQFLMILL